MGRETIKKIRFRYSRNARIKSTEVPTKDNPTNSVKIKYSV